MQGALGAITFWIVGIPSVLLLGVIMAIASLLPAIGPAIVWVPAAVYLLATGAIWQGVVVIVSGVAVIGMIDNVLEAACIGVALARFAAQTQAAQFRKARLHSG